MSAVSYTPPRPPGSIEDFAQDANIVMPSKIADEPSHLVMRTDQQEVERIRLMTENDAQVETDTKLIKTLAELANTAMGMRLPERFSQHGN
jgi:hypothetical protein